MSASDDIADVAILGGGPAGAFAARRLAGSGFSVVLFARPSRHRMPEGLAHRAVHLLEQEGCRAARAAVDRPVRRMACWNGETMAANSEYVIARPDFDRALLSDAAEAGARLVTRSARRPLRAHDRWVFDGPEGPVRARFLVDARGRSAPSRAAVSGPPTMALACRCTVSRPSPGTAVVALPDGWAWIVIAPDGAGMIQFLCDGAPHRLPPKGDLRDHYDRFVTALRDVFPLPGLQLKPGAPAARGAATRLNENVVGARSIRIGDAAATIDPLSGHGLFEALASAHAAVPVINTLLGAGGDRAAALQFYKERCEERFFNSAIVGRDFYRSERRWRDRAFWRARSDWPAEKERSAAPGQTRPGFQIRPVIDGGVVGRAPVWVDADYPRGIWKVADVTLERLHRLQEKGFGKEEIAQRLQVSPGAVDAASGWLDAQSGREISEK